MSGPQVDVVNVLALLAPDLGGGGTRILSHQPARLTSISSTSSNLGGGIWAAAWCLLLVTLEVAGAGESMLHGLILTRPSWYSGLAGAENALRRLVGLWTLGMYGAASGFRGLYTLESGDLTKLGQSVNGTGTSSMS